MPRFDSRHANGPPKQVPSQPYFAAALALYLGLNSTQDVHDFREMETRQGAFSFTAKCACVEQNLSPVLSAVEIGVTMRD